MPEIISPVDDKPCHSFYLLDDDAVGERPALAGTGVEDSGFGYSLSDLGFRSVTRPKSYHLREESA